MYDTFSGDYDRFVNWQARLAVELPFLEQQLRQAGGAGRVLDAACGTGMHAVALAERGFKATGTDLYDGMIVRARANATAAGVDVPFEVAGFGELARKLGRSPLFPFDALFCLGNSLPHLLTPAALAEGLADFAACLRPGGLLLIQNRNFDAVMSTRERWMEPQSHREGAREWLFIRFYDYKTDGSIRFNIITLTREGEGDWHQQVTRTSLHPLLQDELLRALATAGFGEIVCYGDLVGHVFDPRTSGNLVVTARKSG